jgi:A/G-specific adenine glycosylase
MKDDMPPTRAEPIGPAKFQKVLLKWYDRNKRDLPWRGSKDPYAIFVSEMMLQQTQVKTVIPYFTRFLKELPDWKALSRAKEGKVLKLWEGLGYYRRARNLQAAARMVTAEFNGSLPDDPENLRKLPGVGAYSAGALLSIAHQKPYPLVDGNVIRVLSRVFLLQGDLKTGPAHQKLWELAGKLVPANRPGDFNQALMELGATVCLPENPQCLLCPILSLCGAAAKGHQDRYPQSPKAERIVEVPMAALLVRAGERILVRKRPKGERWLQGLWEFPSAEGKTFEEALRKLERATKARASRKEFHHVRHQITRHKIQLKVFPASIARGSKVPTGFRWVEAKTLSSLPFSSAQSKVRALVLERLGDRVGVNRPT